MKKEERRKIYLVIVCISFLQGLQFWVSPLLGQIAAQFPETNISLVQMLVTVPAIVSVFVALGCGWLCTKVSKKNLLLLAALISGVAGIMPWIRDSFELLFFSRIIYGIALGLATTLNTAVVADFFHGKERVTAMGIQAASIGAGMVFITTVAGKAGAVEYRQASWLNFLGFLAFAVIMICLPNQHREGKTSGAIRLNREVWITSGLAFLEFFFLITFSTNIAMHLSGALEGNSTVSGILTGAFSGIQIVAGFILGYVTKWTGKLTLSAAMLSFCIGANAVDTTSCAMASAVFTCAMSLGQFLSPTILNKAAGILLGATTTENVFIIAAAGMAVAALMAAFWKLSNKNYIREV